MVERLVERVEVVPDRLHLAAVDDLVAEAEEDVLGLADDLRERMEVPERRALPRQRDVEALGGVEPAGPLERSLPLVYRSLQALAYGIQGHAGLAVANLAQRELQLALSAEEPDAQILERVGGVSRLDRAQSLVLERLGVHPPTVPSAFVTSRYDPFASVSTNGGRHDGRRAVLCGAREAGAGRADRRAGRGHRACCDSRRAGDRASRDRRRLLAGDARAGACAGRAGRCRPRASRG